MAERSSVAAAKVEWELVITRVFDAPRELVFKAWSEPERVMQWLGPKGFTALEFEMNPRPGGGWHARMRSPDGAVYANRGIVHEVVEPDRLVFGFAWEDESVGFGSETRVTISFAEVGGKTEMTFSQTGFASAEDRDGHREGWSESFDKLAEYLASD